jgi:hypothetical protein
MTFDEFFRLGLEKSDVQETVAWGTPALKRKGRFMLRVKDDGETLVVKLDWENHDRLLSERPDLFFKTDHYHGYPALLVALESLDEPVARELLELSWADAPHAARSTPPSST